MVTPVRFTATAGLLKRLESKISKFFINRNYLHSLYILYYYDKSRKLESSRKTHILISINYCLPYYAHV